MEGIIGFLAGVTIMVAIWFLFDLKSIIYKRGYIDGLNNGIMKTVNEIPKSEQFENNRSKIWITFDGKIWRENGGE